MQIASSSTIARNRPVTTVEARTPRRRAGSALLSRVSETVRQALAYSTGQTLVRNGRFGSTRQSGSATQLLGSFLGEKARGASPSPSLSQRELRARYSQTHGQQFARLSPQQQQQFLRLAESTQQGGLPPAHLEQLLSSGRLMARDRQGATVLAHLDRLSRQELQPGVDRQQAVRDLAQNLADPQSFNQDQQGTCTVTSIGREHARTNPADFARVTTDLLSRQARTVGQDCSVIPSAQLDLSYPDPRDRTQVERVYQDTMMEYGNGAELTYNSSLDRHERIDRTVNGGCHYAESAGTGLASHQSARVISAMLGRQVENHSYIDGPTRLHRLYHRAEFEGRLGQFSSRDQRMQVTLRWDGQSTHMLNVIRIEGDYVYLDNPWGYGENGVSGPQRTLQGQGGQSKMRLDDFYAALVEYHALRPAS